MRVTAKMIAEELGLSIATVDRVLNNRKGGVSIKTVEKVKSKAQELGYKPNRAAKFLATQKVTNIAFILPVFPNYFWDLLDHEIKEGGSPLFRVWLKGRSAPRTYCPRESTSRICPKDC
ncbi:LacI family DNA-binding transcriptional regulator [Gracilibacillus sp. JCM 18860]|uniref:LacI family DNA-binding transcriptional regulator n=1 Tax=Gracilibacillus sp. JCM 18860 TaxID=1306159 RepID=UPI0006D0CDBA